MISSIFKSTGVGATVQTAEVDDGAITSAKLADDIAIAGTFIGTRPSVTNLADDGEIPITALTANIDANGGARTDIIFAGTGTAGQILIVNNTGGEALTFHNTEGTSLVRGIHADHDTMEANFVGLFVSDGSLWNLIAGGVDSQPDAGLTAS